MKIIVYEVVNLQPVNAFWLCISLGCEQSAENVRMQEHTGGPTNYGLQLPILGRYGPTNGRSGNQQTHLGRFQQRVHHLPDRKDDEYQNSCPLTAVSPVHSSSFPYSKSMSLNVNIYHHQRAKEVRRQLITKVVFGAGGYRERERFVKPSCSYICQSKPRFQ